LLSNFNKRSDDQMRDQIPRRHDREHRREKTQMKSGPRPVPTQLKLLRGNPGQRRIREELRPEQSLDVPDPPAHSTGYAADEWYTVATELHRLGVLTKVD
jgi:hypothetical protein